MNCFSHYKMGCLVYDKLDIEGIDKYAFASGNISSDIVIKLKKLSHYSDNCISIIHSLSIKLISDIDNKDISNLEFSYKLGQITHFIADYYCFAHDKQRYHRNLFHHTIYEIVLDTKLKSNLEVNQSIKLKSADNLETLIANLIDLHEEYICVDNQYMVDINYILSSIYGFILNFVKIYDRNDMRITKLIIQKGYSSL